MALVAHEGFLQSSEAEFLQFADMSSVQDRVVLLASGLQQPRSQAWA